MIRVLFSILCVVSVEIVPNAKSCYHNITHSCTELWEELGRGTCGDESTRHAESDAMTESCITSCQIFFGTIAFLWFMIALRNSRKRRALSVKRRADQLIRLTRVISSNSNPQRCVIIFGWIQPLDSLGHPGTADGFINRERLILRVPAHQFLKKLDIYF